MSSARFHTQRRAGTFVVRFLVSAVRLTPAATAHLAGLSTAAIVAGGQASVLPGVSLTLSPPALTKIERGDQLAGL